MPNPRRLWVVLPATLAICGCGRSVNPAPAAHAGSARTGPAAAHPIKADLTKPFGYSQFSAAGGRLDPLSFGKALARAAGGTWIVIAAHPLDDVKWQMDYNSAVGKSVESTLESMNKPTRQVTWEVRPDYVLAVFGSDAEFAAIKARPPSDVPGIYLCSNSLNEFLKPLSEVWQTPILADAWLGAYRSALAAARSGDKTTEDPVDISSAMNSYPGMTAQPEEALGPAFEMKVGERAGLADIVKRASAMVGCDAAEAGGGWKLVPLSDPAKIAAQIDTWKGRLEQNAANPGTWGSYASRTAGGAGEETQPIPPMREEDQADIESLAALGDPAIPVLAGFISSQKPVLANAAISLLAAMDRAKGRKALMESARGLLHPADPKDSGICEALAMRVFRALEKTPSRESARLFYEVIKDERASPKARFAARLALVRSGDAGVLQFARGSSTGVAWQPAVVGFNLTHKPVASTPNAAASPPGMPGTTTPHGDSLSPVTVTRAPDGDEWAVFLSNRNGDSRDIWIARGRGGKWEEFLFSGRPFQRGQDYRYSYGQTPPQCALDVNGDALTLRSPDSKLPAELDRLNKEMQKPNLTPKQRADVTRKYGELSQKAGSTIKQPMTLSVAELRKDTDRDGIPDLVEKRFGSDPAKADTDGDGVADDLDQNPVGKANNGDRGQMLQAIFSVFFGGDMTAQPVFVILDKPYWQTFTGAKERVWCITRGDYSKQARQLGAFRALEFGGPSSQEDTILQTDGPCLFNQTRDLAEVHFWLWNTIPPRQGEAATMNNISGMSGDSASSLPIEYVARFRWNRGWSLLSIRPWRFRTADRAVAESMTRGRSDMMNY